jgi:enamine deaminase RidA (YjgF/YER057c/UK114 family)
LQRNPGSVKVKEPFGLSSLNTEVQVSFQRVFSGSPWEKRVGYCRALRVDDRVFVTGTAAVNEDGSAFAPGDAYAQAQRCFEIMATALRGVGAGFADVTRTRMFVTDIDRWEEYGRAHGEVFGEFPPTTTMVEVRRLIDPDMLIEIEADAVVLSDAPDNPE